MKVVDCCDLFSVGTLTYAKMLVTVLRALLPPYLNILQ
jgi:hypothetical protein